MNTLLTSLAILSTLTAAQSPFKAGSPQVSPAVLEFLAKGNGNDQRAAQMLAASVRNAVVATKTEPKNEALALLGRTVRAGVAKQSDAVRSFQAPQVPGGTVVQTALNDGATLFTTGLSQYLLVPVTLRTGVDEETMKKAVAKVVLSRLLIPASAQTPVTGGMSQKTLPNGGDFWFGTLFFGYTPDANGVYKISDPKWHDHVYTWTDGQVIWIQFSRDDLRMGAASGNPNGITRKGGG